MKSAIIISFILMTTSVFAQTSPKKEASKKQVYELTGAINLQSISNANPAFVGDIPPSYFNDINELYTLLQEKGTLRLVNATLNLTGITKNKVTLSFHKIELINSEIYIQNNDVSIICNEYRQSNSHIQSFNESETSAQDGGAGSASGQDGANGENGLNSGNVFVFVTDKILASSGNIDYYLWGQNGGKGGNGNIGANGAEGSRGRNCSDGTYQCNRGNGAGNNGGKGGNGGNGGNGGEGGDAGKLTFKLFGSAEPYNQYFTYNGPNGVGGEYGNPAPGGFGGKGGKPGSSRCGSICEPYTNRSGNTGQNGADGIIGQVGANGTAKVLTRGTFNVDILKDFLTSWSDQNTKNKSLAKSNDESLMIIQTSNFKN